MKKWILLTFILPFALSPSVGRAGPIVDIGLQFIGITTTIAGDPSGNFVNFTASNGQLGQSFSGNAQSAASAVGFVIGFGQFSSNSNATSVAWDAKFKVNQPGLTFEIILSFLEFGQAVTDGDAFANEHTSVSLSLDGVPQLSDHQGASCNTFVLSCQNPSAGQGNIDVILEHLVVGQLIDIAGSLSADASANAGPACGTPFDIVACVGLGLATSTATFSVSAIPEPPNLLLFGTGLLLVAFALRRARA